jgi:hypothetical protein
LAPASHHEKAAEPSDGRVTVITKGQRATDEKRGRDPKQETETAESTDNKQVAEEHRVTKATRSTDETVLINGGRTTESNDEKRGTAETEAGNGVNRRGTRKRRKPRTNEEPSENRQPR